MASDLLPSKDRMENSNEPLKDISSGLYGFVVIVVLLLAALQLLLLFIGALICLGSKLFFFTGRTRPWGLLSL
jgi:hypothetical protein